MLQKVYIGFNQRKDYLHLLDKVQGASHFYISDEKALQIYKELQALTSGYLVPKLAREIGGEPNKTLYTA